MSGRGDRVGRASSFGRRPHERHPGVVARRAASNRSDRIRRAYEFADRCYAGRCRKSGDPYITHPVAVAQIAAGSGLDDVVVRAALLHDITEDTGRLREQFGDEIAAMVEGMIELDRDEAAIAT